MEKFHKKRRSYSRPRERKFSSVFTSGNEQVHMSSASSPFQGQFFSAEGSVDYSLDHPEPGSPNGYRSTSSDSLSTSSSSTIRLVAASNSVQHKRKNYGRSKQMYLVTGQNRPASREQPEFMMVMKSTGANSRSSRSGSSSGRGRTRKVKDSSSSSSTSSSRGYNSYGVPPVGQTRVSSKSPVIVLQVEPHALEAKPRKKSKSPGGRRDHGPPSHHRSHSYSHHRQKSPRHQHQRMSQMPPVEQRPTELEICPHTKSSQSSIVIRHVCKKCQESLDKGNTLIRRRSISTTSGQRRRYDKSRLGDEDEQMYDENREIYANRAFMRCYENHHQRSVSAFKNKGEPTFTVRNLSELRKVPN
ncbi:hypothetical protein Aperf_G00000010167 [Anoplocephala perfoliata]